jgi:hypothetical protein
MIFLMKDLFIRGGDCLSICCAGGVGILSF